MKRSETTWTKVSPSFPKTVCPIIRTNSLLTLVSCQLFFYQNSDNPRLIQSTTKLCKDNRTFNGPFVSKPLLYGKEKRNQHIQHIHGKNSFPLRFLVVVLVDEAFPKSSHCNRCHFQTSPARRIYMTMMRKATHIPFTHWTIQNTKQNTHTF